MESLADASHLLILPHNGQVQLLRGFADHDCASTLEICHEDFVCSTGYRDHDRRTCRGPI
jgi:hypothetical protein